MTRPGPPRRPRPPGPTGSTGPTGARLAGTGLLLRVALRADRVRLPVWVVSVAGLLAGSAASTAGLYPTRASLERIAQGLADTPATLAFYGPAAQLDTVGGIVLWKPGGILLVLTGLLATLTVVRHTRAEEEVGRAELLGAGAVGRLAPLAAAVLLASGTAVVLGGAVAGGLVAGGAGGVGALGAGLAYAATGFVFSGVGAVAAQLGLTARAANGLAGAVLGAAYGLRAVGDGEPQVSWLAWLSPIGWVQRLEPYAAQPRWWVLVLPLVAGLLLVASGVALRHGRDLGAAWLAGRPGPASAGPRLAGAFGLAWRLQRGVLAAWALAALLVGALVGWLAASIGSLVGTDPGTRELFAKLGGGAGGLADSYLATAFGFFGVAASVYAVTAILRLRSEETAGRAEPLLAGGVSRHRLLASHLVVAALGVLLLVTLMGLACGLARGLGSGDLGRQLGRDLLAGLAQAPPAWLLAAVGCLLVGAWPRAAVLTWPVLAVAVTLGLLGAVLGLPPWVQDLSPYAHLPPLPGGSVAAGDLLPVAALVVLAGALVAGGAWRYGRRDLTG